MCIFAFGMKKVLIIVSYWLAAIILTALLLTSLDYGLWTAAAMSLSFLPAAMALSFLFIYLWQWLFISLGWLEGWEVWSVPSMLGNPVFVAAVLAILAYGYYLLEKWLERKYPSESLITFTSDYKKVSLAKEDILYVESRDSEVLIIARDGHQYRNRTGISQWENLLGPGFIRTHRSFLVNMADASLQSPDSISIAGHTIPISRKYKDSVLDAIEETAQK